MVASEDYGLEAGAWWDKKNAQAHADWLHGCMPYRNVNLTIVKVTLHDKPEVVDTYLSPDARARISATTPSEHPVPVDVREALDAIDNRIDAKADT
jgi:hypothetical protein